jgi:hypothetical protein
MKTVNNTAAKVQGTPAASAPVDANATLFAMFQQFIQAQQAPAPPPAVTPTLGAEVPAVKSKARGKKQASAPVESAPAKEVNAKGVHVHEIRKNGEISSFFVYGEQAPAKLAGFFEKKPHLNRGFRLHEIVGVGNVKAFWFGGRQIAKVKKAIA